MRLPAWSWQDAAACKNLDVNLFFGHEGERYDQGAKDRRERQAKAVCAACPVRLECLAYAIGRPERAGVWGGMTGEERTRERRNACRRGQAAARRAGEAA